MNITDIKIDSDTVLFMNDESKTWEEMPTSFIDDLERLVREIEHFDFPKTTQRVPVYFETKYDLGTSSVSSVKDGDGDITYTFYNSAKNTVQIDEDAAFEDNSYISTANSRNSGSREVNLWATEKKSKDNISSSKNRIEKESREKNTHHSKTKESHNISEKVERLSIQDIEPSKKKSKRLVENIASTRPSEIEASSTKKMLVCVKLGKIPKAVPREEIKSIPKRNTRKNEANNKINDLRQKMKIAFLELALEDSGSKKTKKTSSGEVKYMKAGKEFNRTKDDCLMYINYCKYVSKYSITGLFESNFFILPNRKVDKDEDSFDVLLDKIVK